MVRRRRFGRYRRRLRRGRPTERMVALLRGPLRLQETEPSHSAAKRQLPTGQNTCVKFFVPAAADDDQAEVIWNATRKFAQDQLAWRVEDRRIFQINYQ